MIPCFAQFVPGRMAPGSPPQKGPVLVSHSCWDKLLQLSGLKQHTLSFYSSVDDRCNIGPTGLK